VLKINRSGPRRATGSEQKSRVRGFVFSLAWALSLIVVAAVPAFSQQPPVAAERRPVRTGASPGIGPATIRISPEHRTLAPGVLQVERRPAIAFVPFPMVDPHTRKPIDASATITLPNGKVVKAGEYYDQLNSFEKSLNEQGYSLRLPGTGDELLKVPVNTELLQHQIDAAPRPTMIAPQINFMETHSYKALSVAQPVRLSPETTVAGRPMMLSPETLTKFNSAGLTAHTRDGMVIDPVDLSKICIVIGCGVQTPPVSCTPVQKSASWNWNTGEQSTFEAYLNGTLGVSGEACKPPVMAKFEQNNSNFELSAEGKAGGYVFGVGGDLLRLTGSFDGNQANDTVSANLGVFVLGQSVYTLNKSATGQWGVDDSVSKGVDFSTSIPIPVGPFNIDVTIGAQGSVGVGYSLNLYPDNVSAAASPFVNTSVYAQAGLNVVVAEAGVGVQMTLLNTDLQLGVNAGIGFLGEFYLSSEVYADVTLDMLNGSVYVYAKVYYPCFDPWPDICNKEYKANLWSWSGYQYNSVLFDDKTTTPLHWIGAPIGQQYRGQ
jgi:hypothetical protein